MYSVYYDTPDLDLKKDGVALRLRREGKRWVQTLKGAGRVEAGLHQRVELEKRVPAQLLRLPRARRVRPERSIRRSRPRAVLQPVFTADYTRTSRHLAPDAGSDIELCFDVGTISAGEASAPISEVELELQVRRARAADRLRPAAAGAGRAAPGAEEQGRTRLRAGRRPAGRAGKSRRPGAGAADERDGRLSRRRIQLPRRTCRRTKTA